MEMVMNDYLECVRALRSQANDIEDNADKLSAQEQMLISDIGNIENDLLSVKSERRIIEDKIDAMDKEKGQICSEMIVKQKKIASLESDSLTIIQAFQLIQQDSINLYAKCQADRINYVKVSEALNAELQEKQDWFNSHLKDVEGHELAKDIANEQMLQIGGKAIQTSQHTRECLARKMKIKLAKEKLCNLGESKTKLSIDIMKMKECNERTRSEFKNFNCELQGLGVEMLEEELKALESDKTGESQFLHSLKEQIHHFKGLSQIIKCDCGEEYKLEVDD